MSAPLTATKLREEFPALFGLAEQYDFAERLGGCTDPLMAEADAALRELWMARENVAAASSGDTETGR